MSEETRLTEQEKQHLNALKLFLERSSDLKVLESGKVIDALSPEKRREVRGVLIMDFDSETRREALASHVLQLSADP